MLEKFKRDSRLADWVSDNRDSAMQDRARFERSVEFHNEYGLPVHNTAEKSWDSLLALYDTIQSTDPSERVLDAGGEKYSTYLPGLRRLGYQDLTAINIVIKEPEVRDDVKYQYGDITKTDFPAEHFGFVACLSVLEHGVDWRAFLSEAARILRPGGGLFISVDYWDGPIDTQGKVAYGVPIHIFDAEEITSLIAYGAQLGFKCKPVNFRAKNKLITWHGLQYTFFALSLTKTAN
jgi:SAM-dependent methyltransferase